MRVYPKIEVAYIPALSGQADLSERQERAHLDIERTLGATDVVCSLPTVEQSGDNIGVVSIWLVCWHNGR